MVKQMLISYCLGIPKVMKLLILWNMTIKYWSRP